MSNGKSPMLGRMIEADFEKNTITFEMVGEYYAASGEYEIRPAGGNESSVNASKGDQA